LDYQLLVGNKRLASDNHDEVIRLPANEKQTVTVDVMIYLNDALPLLSSFLYQSRALHKASASG